ncbi:LOW QUALITY PROTEIN: elongator complex protein 4-like [Liolophura sinensis]|uniref:LOW QUALITY PROTEIN: elongator complex protein 4-like n=1 Tax=Liolophura sinensis TaxID=3198878 RepID=UPI003158B289
MASGTSFQRKTRAKVSQIAGVKPSLQNNQLLVSTGVPSFDLVIGGGIAVGSVVIVEEDTYGNYAKLLLKYFLAEGVMCSHHLHVSSADLSPDELLKELPGPVTDEPVTQHPDQADNTGSDSLKIAWRYQNLPKLQPGQVASKFGHYYDLTKTMSPERVDAVDKTLFDVAQVTKQQDADSKSRYVPLLRSVKQMIDTGQFLTKSTTEKRNILRIGIHSLGSPLWGENGGVGSLGSGYDAALPRFLIGLRALLRSAYAVCLLTVPSHLFQDIGFTSRIERLGDTVVALQSFAGSDKEKNPLYKEYHGLFNIIQLPHLNTLTPHMPDTMDWAFKLRRKKFTIEKLHLPPELSETTSRSQEDPAPNLKQSRCGSSSGSSKLDF